MNPPDNLPPISTQREILSWAFDQFGDADFDKLADKRMFNRLESWLIGIEAMNPMPDDINIAVSESLFALLDPENSEDLDQPATGVEARVCEDIAARQRLGIAKYGVTVEQSPDDMLQHAMHEAYDLSVYMRAEWERRQAREWQNIESAPNGLSQILVTDGDAVWIDQKLGTKINAAPGDYYFNGHEKWQEVSHWMPLPPPPAEMRAK